MSTVGRTLLLDSVAAAPASGRVQGRSRRLVTSARQAEECVLALVLAAMVALPLAEIGLRAARLGGIPGGAGLVQHLTLWIGMLGGMLAAREQRLLALSTAHWLPVPLRTRSRWFAHSVAVTAAAALALAAGQFVAAEREAAQPFIAGVPLWAVELVLPAGFGLIAWRLCATAGTRPWERIASAVAAAAVLLLLALGAIAPAAILLPAFVVLFAAALLGAPIFAVLGAAGLVLFRAADVPIAAMPVEHYRLTTNPALPSIPLFTLTGYFMAEGGAASRLLHVFQSLFGWLRGGPVIAVVLVCAFFTAFTGGSGVTILALGGVMMPILIGARFAPREALGLVTGAGSLGVLLPPCLPVILYAIIARADINQMFLGGFAPGMLLVLLTIGWGLWVGRRQPGTTRAFDPRAAATALWRAKWELLLPVLSLTALFSGWATPVEAAALSAAYAFVVEFVIHRELRLARDGVRVAKEAGLLVGGILLILGVALGLTNYLIDAQIPDTLAAWAETHVESRWLFLLGLNLLLILVGGVVEIYAAIVVVAPLLAPIGARLGLDPIHLGVLFLANLELGFLAPPIGLNLLLASSRLGRPVGEVARATLPLLAVMFLGVLLITYWPPLTTALPALFSSSP